MDGDHRQSGGLTQRPEVGPSCNSVLPYSSQSRVVGDLTDPVAQRSRPPKRRLCVAPQVTPLIFQELRDHVVLRDKRQR